ncbi:MAG TPA: YihY/virulence factor BrkB family protein [Gammaproteobacteria bacterium]|nr:YihY/virulence factor BrkB family protein [Gammaproteobacteria bacterium]
MLLRSVQRFFDDEAFQLAAALAYYSLLSMAPLLLIAVGLAGVFFADGRVHMELIEQMRSLVGNAGAELAQTVIDHTGSEKRSAWSLLAGGVLMFVGATTVFAQLQHALNRVWRVEAEPGNAIASFVKQRILSFAIVLAIGFLLMVSLVISAVLGALHAYLDVRLEAAAVFWQALDLAISFGLSCVLIALMFKYLPDRQIEWRDTWLGATITSVLFIVGKHVIGLYLGQTTIASSFGAAGSVVVFMIWVYYAALILLFGAEVTQAVADRRGTPTPPSEFARPADTAAKAS